MVKYEIMLDIETLGLSPGSVVLSIGAVLFSFDRFDRDENQTYRSFYREIDIKDSARVGLTADPETVAWWAQQDYQARKVMVDGLCYKSSVASAASDFTQWYRRNAEELRIEDFNVWAQGNMDTMVLGAMFKAVGYEPPWRYNLVRDTRTAYDILDFDPYSVTRENVAHHALDDAIHQVNCLRLAVTQGN